MITKILGFAMLAAAITPAMAQFGAEYSANQPVPSKTTVAKAKAEATPAPAAAPAEAAPAPKLTKSQKISNATQSVGRAAGYVPAQGKPSRFFRKGVRAMQGVVAMGAGQGSEQAPRQ